MKEAPRRTVVIVNDLGVHLRAAGALVQLAGRFRSNIWLERGTMRVNGKSIMSVLSLAASKGVELVVWAEGEDAEQAVSAVEAALGPIEVLVNCAGAARRTPPAELTAEHWHSAMDAKYFTYVHAMDAVLHGMAARGNVGLFESQRRSGSDLELRANEIQAGDRFRDGMLDLQPGIDLEEIEPSVGSIALDQELHRWLDVRGPSGCLDKEGTFRLACQGCVVFTKVIQRLRLGRRDGNDSVG